MSPSISLKISTSNPMASSTYNHGLNNTMIDDLSPTPTQSRIASNNDESLNSHNNNNNCYIQNYSKIALEDGNYQYLYHGVSMNIHTIYCYHYTPSSQCNCTINNTEYGSSASYSCSHLRQQTNTVHDNHETYDYYMGQYQYKYNLDGNNMNTNRDTQSPTYSYSTTGNYHRNRDIDTKTSSDSRIAGVYGVENTLNSYSASNPNSNSNLKTANNFIIYQSKIASDSDSNMMDSPKSDISISCPDLHVSSYPMSMMSPLNLDH